ncbi:outer membrane lipoprotein carrier protein LolA [Galbibacter sp. EGI 63066]|uniref:LolA family protein n=1 Tax=Galbibacter sp. EGI 63066 TaxID=2993559 RepID=UPI00224912FD|nr:outer membrane lipoprotein carrier protein LolA [Galbibacter sp. EGI 63066]MCX2678346.1 outer membrane lipoprotein carrier protein LolA [Galbibacter sp. EGI 63066]
MNRAILCVFLLIGISVSAQTKMEQHEIDMLKSKVKERAAQTKTITSDFIQYKHLDFLSNDIETSGKLAFKAPDIVKWEYTDPFKYEILFKEETLYINDEGKKSNVDIGSSELFEQLNKLIVNSIKGDMFNEDEFSISYYRNGEQSEVHFDPKKEDFAKYIKSFHIFFNAEGDVEAVKMIEPSEDYTKIVFKNKLINEQLSDEIFTP